MIFPVLRLLRVSAAFAFRRSAAILPGATGRAAWPRTPARNVVPGPYRSNRRLRPEEADVTGLRQRASILTCHGRVPLMGPWGCDLPTRRQPKHRVQKSTLVARARTRNVVYCIVADRFAHQVLRRTARARGGRLLGAGRRNPGPDRAERRRQDHIA